MTGSTSIGDVEFVANGVLECRAGGHRFAITEGIARLIDSAAIAEVSRVERGIRDRDATPFAPADVELPQNALEVEPTLDEVGRRGCRRILELGCGTGRYTHLLARMAEIVVAIDFSFKSLRINAGSLPPDAPVALVEADATRLAVAPAEFDVALSTLVSNLPGRTERQAMFGTVATALTPEGRFVFGTHYYGVREWARRTPRIGYYQSGIFRQYFRRREIEREAQPYFRHLESRPISIVFPGTHRLALPALALNRAAAHTAPSGIWIPALDGRRRTVPGPIVTAAPRRTAPTAPAPYGPNGAARRAHGARTRPPREARARDHGVHARWKQFGLLAGRSNKRTRQTGGRLIFSPTLEQQGQNVRGRALIDRRIRTPGMAIIRDVLTIACGVNNRLAITYCFHLGNLPTRQFV